MRKILTLASLLLVLACLGLPTAYTEGKIPQIPGKYRVTLGIQRDLGLDAGVSSGLPRVLDLGRS